MGACGVGGTAITEASSTTCGALGTLCSRVGEASGSGSPGCASSFVGNDIGFHVVVVTGVMSTCQMTYFILELIDGKRGLDSLIMDDGTIGDVFVDVFGCMGNRRLNRFTLNNRLNRFVDVMMREMMSISAAFNDIALGGHGFLVIGDAAVHLLIARLVFIGHVFFVVTVFSFKVFMSVLGGQDLLVWNGLNSMLMMMNLMFASDVLVYLLLFRRKNGLVRRFWFDIGVNGCIVMFSRCQDLELAN